MSVQEPEGCGNGKPSPALSARGPREAEAVAKTDCKVGPASAGAGLSRATAGTEGRPTAGRPLGVGAAEQKMPKAREARAERVKERMLDN